MVIAMGSTPAAPSAAAQAAGQLQPVQAELGADRVKVFVGGKLFTEYLFTEDSKYPYFYPVNGPRTGKSVTVRRTEPWPHHSSVFFGCDRVNGGNYWQEGLERGRIVSKRVSVVEPAGDQVVFEQDCLWERPGAESPFSDHRRIAVSAPSPDLRFIDFDVTLTARANVRIEKTNHSLFAVRVNPKLSVSGGGILMNAHGDLSEKGTFGKRSPWADYRGTWEGESEGVAIFVHPQDRWFPPPWFTRDYGFMSPTPMFWLEGGFLEMSDGETLRLRYRVVVHAGHLTKDALEAQYQKWAAKP